MTYIARNTLESTSAPNAPRPERATFFNQLSSKSALIIGFVTSILTIGTLGFIVLLIRLLKNIN